MGLNVEDLVKVANQLVVISQKLPSNINPERVGGYLTVGLDGISTKHILGIGKYDLTQRELYRRFSQEKVHRLYSEWLKDPITSISSWQTREQKTGKYGGAVLFNTIEDVDRPSCDIISFSGLNEHTDEALSLTLGHYLGWGTPDNVLKIIAISDNKVFDEMFLAFFSR